MNRCIYLSTVPAHMDKNIEMNEASFSLWQVESSRFFFSKELQLRNLGHIKVLMSEI